MNLTGSIMLAFLHSNLMRYEKCFDIEMSASGIIIEQIVHTAVVVIYKTNAYFVEQENADVNVRRDKHQCILRNTNKGKYSSDYV